MQTLGRLGLESAIPAQMFESARSSLTAIRRTSHDALDDHH
jgi:hypothetical protein